MPRYSALAIAMLGALASLCVVADTPPEPSTAARQACSLNGRWCVERQTGPSNPGQVEKLRVVECGPEKKNDTSWSTAVRVIGSLAVTNDGACVIDLATGSNLLSPEKKPDDPAFAIYCKGTPARVLPIKKFIVDFESLPRSTSHIIWAESFGLDERDRLAVNTKEGRAFLIDPHSGALLQGSYAH